MAPTLWKSEENKGSLVETLHGKHIMCLVDPVSGVMRIPCFGS